MTVCDMKGLAHDELTNNYYSTLKLPSELFCSVFKLSFPDAGSWFYSKKKKNPMIDVFQTTC